MTTQQIILAEAEKVLVAMAAGMEQELSASSNDAGREVHHAFLRGYRAAIDHLRIVPVVKPWAKADHIASLKAEWSRVCEAMNVGSWHGTEAEALAEIERIKAQIAKLEDAA